MKVTPDKSYLQANRKSDARRQLEEAVQLQLTSLRTIENPGAPEQARSLIVKRFWK
jgi:hypothetical protein